MPYNSRASSMRSIEQGKYKTGSYYSKLWHNNRLAYVDASLRGKTTYLLY